MSNLKIPKSEKHLFAPGPTNVPDSIRREVARDLIHHVTPEYAELLWRITDKLKQIFKTNKYVLSTTATGSAGMEASIVNFFSQGEKVIILNTGNFGNRYVEICRTYKLDVIELKYEWGKAYKIEDVKKALAENPDVKGIIVNHSETSTGVLNDIRPLGEITKDTDMLLIVDAISGLILNEFEFDKWGVDCAVAASQKGFLLPPGLIYFAISEKAKKAMESSDKDFGALSKTLKGNTSLMMADTGNAPAKVIKEFRKKSQKPLLKGAFIEEAVYVGDDQLDNLVNIKSKEELIGEIIGLLQSPAKNVISALKSGGNTISGIVKTLSEREG